MPSGSCIQANPLVVTIYGAPGSGKSMLAKEIAAALDEAVAARVPTDYFFVPRPPDVPLETFLARPLRWDWALLRERLSLPPGTTTSTPDADFELFLRRNAFGGVPLPIRPVMILDAMAPFPDADLLVRLDVPEGIRHARIVERDRRWGTRVADRWGHLEASWAAVEAVEPDLVLDGTRTLAANARIVADRVGREQGNRQDSG